MLFFEERFKPLIVIVGWGPHEEADFEQYYARFGSWAKEKARLALLSDPRASDIPNAYWRGRFAKLAEDAQKIGPGVAVCTSAVLGSALLVGAARAVSWLRGGKEDAHYVSSAVDGFDWLVQRGKQLGVAVPPDARRLAADLDECSRAGRHPSTCLSPSTKTPAAR